MPLMRTMSLCVDEKGLLQKKTSKDLEAMTNYLTLGLKEVAKHRGIPVKERVTPRQRNGDTPPAEECPRQINLSFSS